MRTEQVYDCITAMIIGNKEIDPIFNEEIMNAISEFRDAYKMIIRKDHFKNVFRLAVTRQIERHIPPEWRFGVSEESWKIICGIFYMKKDDVVEYLHPLGVIGQGVVIGEDPENNDYILTRCSKYGTVYKNKFQDVRLLHPKI